MARIKTDFKVREAKSNATRIAKWGSLENWRKHMSEVAKRPRPRARKIKVASDGK